MSINSLTNLINQTIPYAWDNSLSIMEFLGKIVTSMNEVIKLVNDKLPDDFETKFYDTFREYTKAEMDRIVASGEFQTILESIISTAQAVQTEVTNARQGKATLVENINQIKSDLASSTDGVGTSVADLKAELHSHYINVKFPPTPLVPATGNGVTDDGPALQAIINLGKNILIPPGTYKSSVPLTLKKISIIGANTNDTKIMFTGNNHGLIIPSGSFPNRNSVEISGFALGSTAVNRGNYYAVYAPGVTPGAALAWNFGLNLSKIDITGFGGGVFVSDFFRFNADEIGMSGVVNPVYISGSVVQSTFDKITNNCDNPPTSSLNNVGMVLNYKNYADGTHTPESVKSENISFALNEVGLDYISGLFCTFNNLDLDYCKTIGLRIVAEGNFENIYVASNTTTGKFIGVLFDVGDNTRPYHKIVKNAHINAYNALPAGSIAIQYGCGGNAPYLEEWGGVIENCKISASVGNAWKNAINADRNKSVVVKNCKVQSNICSGDDMIFSYSKFAIVEGNICKSIYVDSGNAEGMGKVQFNRATVTNGTIVTPGNWLIGFNAV